MQSIKYHKNLSAYPFGRFVYQHGHTVLLSWLFLLLTLGTTYVYLYLLYDAPKYLMKSPVIELIYEPFIETKKILNLNQPAECLEIGIPAYCSPLPMLSFESIQRDFDFPVFEVGLAPMSDYYTFAYLQISMFAVWANNLYINAKLTFYQKGRFFSLTNRLWWLFRENLPSIIGSIIVGLFAYDYWEEVDRMILTVTTSYFFIDIFCIKNYQFQN